MVQRFCSVLFGIGFSFGTLLAQDTASVDTERASTQEAVEVRLVLFEALAIDRQGNAVPDLTIDEFQFDIAGVITPVESLDVSCSRETDSRTTDPAGTAGSAAPLVLPSRIVFAVDYRHLDHHDRTKVLARVSEMISDDWVDDDQSIMVVALADSLRIEQRFTQDRQELLATLHRMDYDRTLFSVDAAANTGKEWFELLSTLMDVLEVYDGAKAVVLISTVTSRGDLRHDWFEDVYERAAAARVSIYPSFARWMKFDPARRGKHRPEGSAGGRRILPALAVGTGGRMPPNSADLSFAYARARKDLACHYTVGFEVSPNVAADSMDVRLQVRRAGVSVLYPSNLRVSSDEERRESRLRAAFADPQALDNPLVRAQAIPLRAVDSKTWQTLLAVQFPVPPDVGEAGFEVRASLAGQETKSPMIQRSFPVAPSGSVGTPITFVGDTPLKSGTHTLTVALSEPGSGDVLTTQTRFEVPVTPAKGVLLQGPMLARLVDGGELARQLELASDDGPTLDTLLENPESVELLLVNDVETDDALVSFWQLCVATKQSDERSLSVDRWISTAEGDPVRKLERHAFRPGGIGRTRCDGTFDPIRPGTMSPGEYRIEVVVTDDATGSVLAHETAPVSFH